MTVYCDIYLPIILDWNIVRYCIHMYYLILLSVRSKLRSLKAWNFNLRKIVSNVWVVSLLYILYMCVLGFASFRRLTLKCSQLLANKTFHLGFFHFSEFSVLIYGTMTLKIIYNWLILMNTFNCLPYFNTSIQHMSNSQFVS